MSDKPTIRPLEPFATALAVSPSPSELLVDRIVSQNCRAANATPSMTSLACNGQSGTIWTPIGFP